MADFNPKAVLLIKFTEQELPDTAAFDSGDSETNDFFRNDAFRDQERGLNTTTLIYCNGIIAGFISLLCDAIPLNKEEENSQASLTVPAIKLRYGVDKNFKDYDLDSFIIDYAKTVAFELWKSKVGVRFLTLDTDPSREEFFAGKGFVRNRTGSNGLVSMRLDIFA